MVKFETVFVFGVLTCIRESLQQKNFGLKTLKHFEKSENMFINIPDSFIKEIVKYNKLFTISLPSALNLGTLSNSYLIFLILMALTLLKIPVETPLAYVPVLLVVESLLLG